MLRILCYFIKQKLVRIVKHFIEIHEIGRQLTSALVSSALIKPPQRGLAYSSRASSTARATLHNYRLAWSLSAGRLKCMYTVLYMQQYDILRCRSAMCRLLHVLVLRPPRMPFCCVYVNSSVVSHMSTDVSYLEEVLHEYTIHTSLWPPKEAATLQRGCD